MGVCQSSNATLSLPVMEVAQTKSMTSARSAESNVLLGRLSGDASPDTAKGRTPKSAAPTPRMITEIEALSAAVEEQLPRGPRICILGGKQFMDPKSEPSVRALAQLLAEPLVRSGAVVLTGGLPGVQATFAEELHRAGFENIVNLVPLGEQSNYGIGEDLVAGLSVEERMGVFAKLGQIYVCIEGGPGVAKEARDAHQRGAFVLPLMSTGGASGGAFGFPTAALEAPSFAVAEWASLKADTPEEVAWAAATVIEAVLRDQEPADGAKNDVPEHRCEEASKVSL